MTGFPAPKPEQETLGPERPPRRPPHHHRHDQEGETSLMLREDGRKEGTMGASSGSPRREWVVAEVRRSPDGASGPSKAPSDGGGWASGGSVVLQGEGGWGWAPLWTPRRADSDGGSSGLTQTCREGTPVPASSSPVQPTLGAGASNDS